MASKDTTLRLIPELRNYHVANDSANAPSETYYFSRKYDLSLGVPDSFIQINFTTALRLASRSRFSRLVIWEPLWVRLLLRHGLIVLAWKVGTFRKRPVLSYAMENNDLASLMAGIKTVPRWSVQLFALIVGVYIRFAYGRIVYASDGARENYHSLPLVDRVVSETVPNLPAGRPLRREAGVLGSVVMVARMERRKGTKEIMSAWPLVEDLFASAHLTIVGSGPEDEEVRQWASVSKSSRTFLGSQSHDQVLDIVAASSVLVLPSVRDGRWREQIGLPIQEALINGLTVVTSDETGLSDWLRVHGHHVVPGEASPAVLAGAILEALRHPLDRRMVSESLPLVDARITADRWLTGPES